MITEQSSRDATAPLPPPTFSGTIWQLVHDHQLRLDRENQQSFRDPEVNPVFPQGRNLSRLKKALGRCVQESHPVRIFELSA